MKKVQIVRMSLKSIGLLLLFFILDTIQVFAPSCGDVNSSGSIDIVDALLVAQYYVAMVSSLPGCIPAPTSEIIITCSPEPTITSKVFHSIRDTSKTYSSLKNQIILPPDKDGSYDFNIDWCDGRESHITAYNDPEITHSYSIPGIYDLKITGHIRGFSFGDSRFPLDYERSKLLEIRSWGPLNLGNNGDYFDRAENLIIPAGDVLDLTGGSCQEHTYH